MMRTRAHPLVSESDIPCELTSVVLCAFSRTSIRSARAPLADVPAYIVEQERRRTKILDTRSFRIEKTNDLIRVQIERDQAVHTDGLDQVRIHGCRDTVLAMLLVSATVRIVERDERNAPRLRAFERIGEHERLEEVLAQRAAVRRRIRRLEEKDVAVTHVLRAEISVHLTIAEVLDANITDVKTTLTDLLKELEALLIRQRALLTHIDGLRLDDTLEFGDDLAGVRERASGREEVEATTRHTLRAGAYP